ncbi:hypothetical protein ETAA8_66020 [Anatilimnocola aggregata]|uniref:Uncharacterized protein n=1 Tax=Anatilimnocola aggregata TaxID=2528021 RepID=A0A517YMK1_9BACT|nr:hypothetical protein [Anatilimnocola aggregata]QDU31444.1 hypothetical protein ETAA8_66020 [Anatilimnocola aggregata]
MPLRVACSAGHLMMVPDHRAGTVLRCPNCGINVDVPPAAGNAAAPAINKLVTRVSGGPAARQSPQVAGHSTIGKVATSLPAGGMKPPPKSRPKQAPAPAKSTEEPVVFASEEIAAPAPTEAAPEAVIDLVAAPVFAAPPMPEVKPEIAPAAVDAALIETVDVPPPPVKKQKPVEPTKSERIKSEPAKPSTSNRARTTLTGTVLAPPKEVKPPLLPVTEPSPPEPLFIAETFTAETIAEVVEPPIAAPHPQAHESAHEPAPAPPPIAVMIGVRPTPAQRSTAWQLGAVFIAAALFSMGPAVWEISDYLQSDGGQSVARWAFLLLMLGVIQIGCVALLMQIPDWSSVWIVTIQSLALAAIYAAVLGLTIITSGDSPLIGALQLDYQYSSGKAPPWCVCMAATYACLAFFAGRLSARWHKVLRQVKAADEAALSY